MRITISALAAGVSLFFAAVSAPAHHAFTAEFDANQPVTLRGTVSKFEFVNPHSWIHIDVKGPDGQVTTWMVEGGSPNVLIRKGLNKNSLPIGTEVIVEGYRAKSGKARANGRDITLSDGRRILLGGSAPDAGKP